MGGDLYLGPPLRSARVDLVDHHWTTLSLPVREQAIFSPERGVTAVTSEAKWGSAPDTSASTIDEGCDLSRCCHGGVPRGGHGEGAVGGAVFQGGGHVHPREQPARP